jgi:hypothetical protein
MSLWDKTVGSMYHLAERSPPFKRVFTSAQNFINDVSYYANEPAVIQPLTFDSQIFNRSNNRATGQRRSGPRIDVRKACKSSGCNPISGSLSLYQVSSSVENSL